eukprot:gb/GEZN01021563.1/.p1 GENE.gb/GEZN01021563.1/~~gb/GEZN01021563.1/.p1  ORF type:complete len:148 (-),score=8.56 gb/GEZN01021563.1/:56-499(-)
MHVRSCKTSPRVSIRYVAVLLMSLLSWRLFLKLSDPNGFDQPLCRNLLCRALVRAGGTSNETVTLARYLPELMGTLVLVLDDLMEKKGYMSFPQQLEMVSKWFDLSLRKHPASPDILTFFLKSEFLLQNQDSPLLSFMSEDSVQELP